MMSNAPNASDDSGTSTPPAIAASISPRPDRADRLSEGDRAAGARVRRREDRPADAERDPEIGRRRAAEDREGEVRGDLADALLHVPLVLLLGVGDATERAAEVDPDPLRRGGAALAGPHPRVVECQRPRHEPELAEPVELAGGLRRHPGERVEVVDLGGDLGAERRWVEPVDALHRRARLPQPGPERVHAGADRR